MRVDVSNFWRLWIWGVSSKNFEKRKRWSWAISLSLALGERYTKHTPNGAMDGQIVGGGTNRLLGMPERWIGFRIPRLLMVTLTIAHGAASDKIWEER